MPALVKDKDKLLKRVASTPIRVQSKSLTQHEVKRLGPTRRISAKRFHSQSMQTETILVCLNQRKDVETQTIDEEIRTNNNLTKRFIQFFGGTIVSFMKFFQMKS